MTPAELKVISSDASDIARYEPLLMALIDPIFVYVGRQAPPGNVRLPSNPKRALADMQAELGRGQG